VHDNPPKRDSSVEPARPDAPEARPRAACATCAQAAHVARAAHIPPGDGEGYDVDVLNEVLDP
jgi:hypothetical protein